MLPPADDIHLPASLFALCAMSAMAFVLAPAFWLRRAAEGHEAGTLEHTVWRFQIYALLATIFGFMIRNILTYSAAQPGDVGAPPPSLWPEPLILCTTALIFSIRRYRRGASVLRGLRQETVHIALLALACALGWAATAFAGWGLSVVLYGNRTIALFLAGTLWLAPSVILYRCLPEPQKRPAPVKELKFHHILWPVMMAYLALLAPLQIQHLLNTEKWQKARSTKVLPLKEAGIMEDNPLPLRTI